MILESRTNYSRSVETEIIVVEAMSEQHAKRIAAGIAGIGLERIINITCTKKPRAASTCKTEDFPVKGTRKWKTVYQIYAYGNAIPLGRNKMEHTQMEIVADDIETKTEAIKIAKEMAIKHQLPMTIKIAQKLETHDTTCANIIPKTGLGKFSVEYII